MRSGKFFQLFLLSLLFQSQIQLAQATPTAMVTSTPSVDFVFGINGHPLHLPYTQISLSDQLRLVKDELGLGWYRINISDSSFTSNPEKVKAIFAAAKDKGVKLLPVIGINVTTDSNPDALYSAAYEYGKKFVTLAAPYGVTVFELLNETDIPCKVSSGSTAYGYNPAEYDNACTDRYVHAFNGFIKAIREFNNPNLKIILGTAGTHTGYLTKLKILGVGTYDYISWHWYSELTDDQFKTSYNELAKLGKDIWITEYNRRNGSVSVVTERNSDGSVVRQWNGMPNIIDVHLDPAAEQGQANYIRRISIRALKLPRIKALFIYELLDEMTALPNPESYYGLVRVKRFGDPAAYALDTSNLYKPAFYAFKNIVANSKELDKFFNIAADGISQLHWNRSLAGDSGTKRYMIGFLRQSTYGVALEALRNTPYGCQKNVGLLYPKYIGRNATSTELSALMTACAGGTPLSSVEDTIKAKTIFPALSTSYRTSVQNRVDNEIIFLQGETTWDTAIMSDPSLFAVNRSLYRKESDWTPATFEDQLIRSDAILRYQVGLLSRKHLGRPDSADQNATEYWMSRYKAGNSSGATLTFDQLDKLMEAAAEDQVMKNLTVGPIEYVP